MQTPDSGRGSWALQCTFLFLRKPHTTRTRLISWLKMVFYSGSCRDGYPRCQESVPSHRGTPQCTTTQVKGHALVALARRVELERCESEANGELPARYERVVHAQLCHNRARTCAHMSGGFHHLQGPRRKSRA